MEAVKRCCKIKEGKHISQVSGQELILGKMLLKQTGKKKLGRTCLEFEMLTNIAFANILIKTKKKTKTKLQTALKVETEE